MEKQTLANFGAGAWEHPDSDIKHPGSALSTLQDGHIDSSGIVRVRGAVGQQVATALAGQRGEFVWCGRLLPGVRALAYSRDVGAPTGSFQRLNAALTGFAAVAAKTFPKVDGAVVIGNTLVVGTGAAGGAGQCAMWGGSLKDDFVASTTASTSGSRVLTRVAGGFTANVDVGMNVTGGALFGVVQSVDSDTQVTLDRAQVVTGSTTATFRAWLQLALGIAPNAGIPGGASGRLLLMDDYKLRFSRGPDPATGLPRHSDFPTQNVHEFPVDASGIAIATLRDRVVVFTVNGIYAVGGMAYEITDGSGNPQHPIEELTSKSIALSQRGIVKWQNALLVPCRDGLYAMDGYGQPVELSRAVPWAEMVRDGMEVGFATVFKGRYVMPYRMAEGEDPLTMVFRMDGVETEGGTVFPKSKLFPAGKLFAYTTSPQPDQVLAVGVQAGGVLSVGEMFSATTSGVDYNNQGTGLFFKFETRPVPLGDKALVRRVRIRYSFTPGIVTTDPEMDVYLRREGGAQTPITAVPLQAGTHWAAADLEVPVESHSVIVGINLQDVKIANFAVHAVEIQYRGFGGR